MRSYAQTRRTNPMLASAVQGLFCPASSPPPSCCLELSCASYAFCVSHLSHQKCTYIVALHTTEYGTETGPASFVSLPLSLCLPVSLCLSRPSKVYSSQYLVFVLIYSILLLVGTRYYIVLRSTESRSTRRPSYPRFPDLEAWGMSTTTATTTTALLPALVLHTEY